MNYRKYFLPLALLLTHNIVLAETSNVAPAEQSADATDSSVHNDLYLEAERAFLRGDSQSSITKINQLLAAGESKSRTIVKTHNLKGLIYFQTKNISAAAEEFQQAVDLAAKILTPNDSIYNLAKYNLANALYQNSQVSSADETLNGVDPSALDLDTRIRFYHLQGNINASKNENALAAVSYAYASNISKDVNQAQGFIQKIIGISKKLYAKNPKEDLDKFVTASFEMLPSLDGSWAIQVLLARGYLYVGESAKAQDLLKGFLEKSPENHAMRTKAEEMIQQLQKLAEVDTSTIGILLPLSGKFAKFGRLCLNAALLAQGAFENITVDEKFSNIRFAVRDSGDSPESATEAFTKLVMEDHAIGVIGPLLSKQALPVAQKAQEYGVPLFSLSQKGNLDQIGSFIFPLALTPNQQVETIVKYAVEKKGYKKFSIMAPDDNFGDEYIKIFWDAIDATEAAEVVAVERYEPKSTDFREEIKRLLGLEYLGARKIEMEELKRRENVYASTIKVKGLLRKRLLKAYDPKPLLNFDAIFIADDPQAIGQIAPAFAVKDIVDLPLLGINTWNTPEIVQRAGRYMQQSLFVDAFFPQSTNSSAAQFTDLFQKNFGSVPGTIEVQAYDAAKIALHTLSSTELNTRAQYRDAIANLGKFQGISGEFLFTESGIKRNAYLLTVTGSNITEVSAPTSLKK